MMLNFDEIRLRKVVAQLGDFAAGLKPFADGLSASITRLSASIGRWNEAQNRPTLEGQIRAYKEGVADFIAAASDLRRMVAAMENKAKSLERELARAEPVARRFEAAGRPQD